MSALALAPPRSDHLFARKMREQMAARLAGEIKAAKTPTKRERTSAASERFRRVGESG